MVAGKSNKEWGSIYEDRREADSNRNADERHMRSICGLYLGKSAG